jgi:endonuclease-3
MNSARDLRAKALEVHARLLKYFGEPERIRDADPIDVLVRTILSQNTNDILRDQAYDRLCDKFRTWEEVRDAPAAQIEAAIQTAGLGHQKARSIKESLQRITAERGHLELDFLRQMPVSEAKAWLTALNGVGPKTAAIVLLFALNMPAFPVDTHVHRVTRRLGLIPEKTSREKAHDILEQLLPPAVYYAFHINLIRHGRAICHARKPLCEICPLQDICDYYANLKR